MVVGATLAGMSISLSLLIYWDFSTQPSPWFTENGPKKKKYLMGGICLGENVFLIPELNGQTAFSFKLKKDWKKKSCMVC